MFREFFKSGAARARGFRRARVEYVSRKNPERRVATIYGTAIQSHVRVLTYTCAYAIGKSVPSFTL